MLGLLEKPEHTVQDMLLNALQIQPSCVYKPFHARVVMPNYTQYSRNPVVCFLPATPMDGKGILLSMSSLSILEFILCQ
jgi:hypothetical protein